MMRLPEFRFVAPRSIDEAVEILALHPPGEAMVVAGGTDLLPNMKRRQQTPRTLVGLRRIATLREVHNGSRATSEGDGLTLGAGLTLTDLVRDARIARSYAALAEAAAQVATPHLRNM